MSDTPPPGNAGALPPSPLEGEGREGDSGADIDKTLAACRKRVELRPDDVVAHNELGQLLLQLGRPGEAEACFRKAIALRPSLAKLKVNLGAALEGQHRAAEAIAAYEEALANEPLPPPKRSFGFAQAGELTGALNNLAGLLKDQGRVEEAIALYRKALERAPGDARIHSNLLLSLNYSAAYDAAALRAEHEAWAARFAASLAKQSRLVHRNEPAPASAGAERRLRVGYLSPDFRFHPVAYFIGHVLAAHDREAFEIVCYSTTWQSDGMTALLKGLGHRWRDVKHLGDEAIADVVNRDGIDILVDLAGHTAGSRLGVFARKPAPVQATYLGYPSTTGLATIDYRITDGWADPPGRSDAAAAETPAQSEAAWRLPGGFLSYRPPKNAPQPSEPPAKASGRTTFGSLNNLAKLSPETVVLWSRILREAPESRLLLKSKLLADPGTRETVLARFRAQGIGEERLELLGFVPSAVDHLATYHKVDVALDPYPYGGTTTTCEALWMGVPVVTLAGDRHSGRVGVSLLSAAGLERFVAATPDEYVRLALSLARDPEARLPFEELAKLRAGLRERLARSPLCDTRRLTRALEAAYREMWRRWCAGR